MELDWHHSTMALNIKNEQAVAQARELAAATGESVTRAVATAVRERLDRVRGRADADVAERAARLRQISQDAAPRWPEPDRGAQYGDVLYDEWGLPR